jgi:hypothetical protein
MTIPNNLPTPDYKKGGTKATWMAHLRACRQVHRHNRKLAELRKAAREVRAAKSAGLVLEEGK